MVVFPILLKSKLPAKQTSTARRGRFYTAPSIGDTFGYVTHGER